MKTKFRNRLRAAAIFTAATVALSACAFSGSGNTPDAGGSSAPSAGEEVSGTLTGIFFSGYKDTYEKIATAFEQKYPKVDVKFDYQGGDVGALVMTQLQAATAPDILTTFPGGDAKDNSDNVVPLATQGRILPLSASWAGEVPEAWRSAVNFQDKTYAYPGALQPLGAIYNKSKLDELGLKIPTTLDEVYQLCTDAKSKRVYAYAQGLGDPAGPQMLAFGQMATLSWGPNPEWDAKHARGEVSYADADSPWIAQFKIYKQMGDLGCFGEGALGRTRDQGAEIVAKGQALALVDVGAVLASMKTLSPKTSFVYAAIPATNTGNTYIAALPGFVTTINAKAKNTAAAQAFLDFLGEPEQSATYAYGFQSVPVLPNDVYKAPAELTEFAKLIVDKKYAPLGSVQAEVQTTLNQGIQSLILGKQTPEAVAEKMEKVYKK